MDVSPDNVDAVVEAYKRDVDPTVLARNLRLTPTQRIEQLQRFVALMADLQQAGERLRAGERDGQSK